ncbi:hypothetical protein B0H10DRAFT_1777484 [Mycena sp. CBHHK59/15]|nr:hypothetical protein B0H10DRAFT_1777484 [Mycena sp. CBHHK59/15]
MLESLPVELIAQIVGELSLGEVIRISQLSRRLKLVASDPVLNVWRLPILRNLRSDNYEDALRNLSVYSSVPRHNWIEILSLGKASFILFEATPPKLNEAQYEECFKRRFLPSWRKWRKDDTWRAAFLKVLHQIWHRSCTTCTTNEAWTKYIVLNRNGSANLLETSSRNFSPVVVFNDMRHATIAGSLIIQSRIQHTMHRLEMRVRLVVRFADVRILALGTLNRPRSPLTVNVNAKCFLHPSGIPSSSRSETSDGEHYSGSSTSPMYSRLRYPLPAQTHANYPFYTPGGADKRWLVSDQLEEEGLQWVGGLMIVAQIIGPGVGEVSGNWPPLQDHDLIVGSGRQQYVSLTWDDLWVIAPWLEENITRQIDGPGLGI